MKGVPPDGGRARRRTMATATRKMRALRRRVTVELWKQVPARVRGVRSPFLEEQGPAVVLHCSHHKAGTVWLKNVLHAVARHFGLPFTEANGILPGEGVAISEYGSLDMAGLPALRGSHMIRDPRDMVVSGYFYHLWTDEAWVHEPLERLGGRSYQAHLQSLSLEEGLAEEIANFVPVAKELFEWDYGDDRFLELRYEDAIADEEGVFRKLFTHYGFGCEAVERAVHIAAGFSFVQMAGRPLGHVRPRSHLRSGLPGQWRDLFGPEHSRLFDELTDSLVARLGYPPDERLTR